MPTRILQLGIDINVHSCSSAPLKAKVNSPLSVAMVLGELLLGANGKTSKELVDAFGIDGNGEFHNEFGKLVDEFSRTYQLRGLRRR